MRWVCFVLAIAAGAPPAHAGPARVHLVYSRHGSARACPDAEALQAAVVGYLGRDPFAGDGSHLLTCAIDGDARALRLTITLGADEGTEQGARTLTGPADDCPALIDAAALTIAIALRAEAETPPEPEDVTLDPQAEADAPPDVRALEQVSVQASVRHALGVGVVASAGFAPTVLAGLVVALDRRVAALSGGAELRAFLPGSARLAGMTRVDVWRVEVALLGCAHRGSAALCGVLQGGILRAAAEDLDPSGGITPTFATGLRATWQLPALGNLRLLIYADGSVALTRTTLFANDAALWQQPVASFGLGVTAIFALP